MPLRIHSGPVARVFVVSKVTRKERTPQSQAAAITFHSTNHVPSLPHLNAPDSIALTASPGSVHRLDRGAERSLAPASRNLFASRWPLQASQLSGPLYRLSCSLEKRRKGLPEVTRLARLGHSKMNEGSRFVLSGSKAHPEVRLTVLVIGHGSTNTKLEKSGNHRNELSSFRD